MVTAAEQLIELNADVPFPPFPLWLRLPASWAQLDSNPQTWRRSADALVNNTFRGSRLAAADRRHVLEMLEGLVADCQRAGAALSLLTVGWRRSGGAASFGIHLALADDGRPASLARVHDVLPRTGTTTEIVTGSGPAVMHRDRMTMAVPGTGEIVSLTSIQVFVPISGSTWTVVLSTASAFAELTGQLEELLRSIAESISTDDLGGDDHDPGPIGDFPEDERVQGWIPSDRRTAETAAVGFERGFGTLARRRLGPADVQAAVIEAERGSAHDGE